MTQARLHSGKLGAVQVAAAPRSPGNYLPGAPLKRPLPVFGLSFRLSGCVAKFVRVGGLR